MRKYGFIFLLVCLWGIAVQAQTARYSTRWFGPNANPVPEFTDARIPERVTLTATADYYFGHGDRTKNGYLKLELPLIPKRVSFKIWSSVLEHYDVDPALAAQRGMEDQLKGSAAGDVYVQTRINFLKEKKKSPAIILNSTLRTASGGSFRQRRYFDTPGYYFDIEIGKSIFLKSKLISEIRIIQNYGFMCWETTNSTQDDAAMYGGKVVLSNKNCKLEGGISGYSGWMRGNPKYGRDYGDAPILTGARFTYMTKNLDYFAQFQYGIRDFPYNQARIGASLALAKINLF